MTIPPSWRAGAARQLRRASLTVGGAVLALMPGGAVVAGVGLVVFASKRSHRRWDRWWIGALGAVLLWSAVMAGTAYAQAAPAAAKGYDLLPAWRWGFGVSTHFEANLGAGDMADSITVSLAEICFSFAGAIWLIILWLCRLAAGEGGPGGSSVVKDLISPINQGFGAVGKAIITSGVWGAVAVMGVAITLIRGLKTGGPAKLVRGLLTVILPLSLLSVMATAAAGGDQRLSPGWLADRAVKSVQGMGDAVTNGFEAATLPAVPADDATSCERYIHELHVEYSAGTSPKLAAQISTLWERAYLAQWRSAQFSGGPIGKRVDCRLLELRNATSRPEQDRITAAAGAPGPTGGKHLVVYGPPEKDKKEHFRRQVAWAACQYNGGGWQVSESFRAVDSPPVVPEHCSNWWTTGDTKPDPDNGNGVPVFEFQGGWGENAIANRTNNDNGSAKEAHDYLNALNGHNGGYGIVMGVIAIIVAFVFLRAVGGMALGMLLAEFGVVVGVVMLPLLLVAIAWPTENSTKVAIKVAKLLAAMVVARIVFGLILGVLLVVIGVMYLIVPGGGDGFTGTLWAAMAPLLAIWIMRYCLKQVGLGNIMSLKGAASMVATLGQAQAEGGQGLLPYRYRRFVDPISRYSLPRRYGKAGFRRLRGLGGATGPGGPGTRGGRGPGRGPRSRGPGGPGGPGAAGGVAGAVGAGGPGGRPGPARGRRMPAGAGGGRGAGVAVVAAGGGGGPGAGGAEAGERAHKFPNLRAGQVQIPRIPKIAQFGAAAALLPAAGVPVLATLAAASGGRFAANAILRGAGHAVQRSQDSIGRFSGLRSRWQAYGSSQVARAENGESLYFWQDWAAVRARRRNTGMGPEMPAATDADLTGAGVAGGLGLGGGAARAPRVYDDDDAEARAVAGDEAAAALALEARILAGELDGHAELASASAALPDGRSSASVGSAAAPAELGAVGSAPVGRSRNVPAVGGGDAPQVAGGSGTGRAYDDQVGQPVLPLGAGALRAYEREHFGPLEALPMEEFRQRFTPQVEGQYRAFLQRRVADSIASQPQGSTYPDTTAAVVGLGGGAAMVQRVIAAKTGQTVDGQELLRTPFSTVAGLIGVDLPSDYGRHYSPRAQTSVGAAVPVAAAAAVASRTRPASTAEVGSRPAAPALTGQPQSATGRRRTTAVAPVPEPVEVGAAAPEELRTSSRAFDDRAPAPRLVPASSGAPRSTATRQPVAASTPGSVSPPAALSPSARDGSGPVVSRRSTSAASGPAELTAGAAGAAPRPSRPVPARVQAQAPSVVSSSPPNLGTPSPVHPARRSSAATPPATAPAPTRPVMASPGGVVPPAPAGRSSAPATAPRAPSPDPTPPAVAVAPSRGAAGSSAPAAPLQAPASAPRASSPPSAAPPAIELAPAPRATSPRRTAVPAPELAPRPGTVRAPTTRTQPVASAPRQPSPPAAPPAIELAPAPRATPPRAAGPDSRPGDLPGPSPRPPSLSAAKSSAGAGPAAAPARRVRPPVAPVAASPRRTKSSGADRSQAAPDRTPPAAEQAGDGKGKAGPSPRPGRTLPRDLGRGKGRNA